ncbi:MAG TPA: acyl-ACP thioesterase, partial [Thalassospira lucentensis]|nr:acyl-ACP thioesterase [Thalassospira lucentensis]
NNRPDFHPESLDIQFRTECRVHERIEIRYCDGFAAITRDEDGTDLVRAQITPRNRIALA